VASPSPLPPPPREIDAHTSGLLREALTKAGYAPEIFRTLGMIGVPGWKNAMRAASVRLPTPACGVLVRFFLARDGVAQGELEPAIGGPAVLSALEDSGLATRIGDGLVQCPFVLVPTAGVLAFSDPIDDPASQDPPEDFILPIGNATRYVDDLAVRDPCDLTIDLGCGQGYLAIHALTHSRRAIATDINPRAIIFARVNASLNGVSDRIECRQGSLFEPLQDVAGEVDLITCNPPFILLPGGHTTAVVSPTEGDGLMEILLRNSPRMLREGGWASLVGIWEHNDASDWPERIGGWVSGTGCDALVLQFRTYRPDEYFQQWFAPEIRAATEERWRSTCENRNVRALTFGGIVLHKRRGPNWVRALFTLINLRRGTASEQLRAYFRTQTIAQSLLSPALLLDRRLRSAPGWRFDPVHGLPTRPPPPSAAPGLVIPLQHAAQYEPLLRSFDGLSTARTTLATLRQSGLLPVTPEDPAAIGMLQGLVLNGCLDIVD
jgi:SAM-dependent methyltransferase